MHCDSPPATQPTSIWWRQVLTHSTPPAWQNSPLIVGKPVVKLIGSLGHAITRFLESHKPLVRHVQKHAQDSMAGLKSWLPDEFVATASLDQVHGLFGTALSWNGQSHNISIQRLWLSHDELAAAIRALPTANVPDHQLVPENAPLLEEPHHANAPIWPALLRLPLLKGYWEQQLRSNLLETLLQVMPKAWLMDPTPVPNGAVIAGLNVPSWDSFGSAEIPHKRFAITPAFAYANAYKAIAASEVNSGLAQYPGQPAVLSAAPAENSEVIIAIYQKSEKGVSLLRSLYLHHDQSNDAVTAGDISAK